MPVKISIKLFLLFGLSLPLFLLFLGVAFMESGRPVVWASSHNQPNQPLTTEIYGAAWSDNIGWISFNHCRSAEVDCGPITYKTIVDNKGWITGAAWSDNIGWIKFGGLSNFPLDAGTVANNARINLAKGPARGKVTGWARACAGTVPGDCSSMNSVADGWDGWISLSGDNHTSPKMNGTGGVTWDKDKKIIGKAWGGEVVGWIDFGVSNDNLPNVFYGPPDLSPFNYSLDNITSVGSPLSVYQGSYADLAITVEKTDGQPDIVSAWWREPSSGALVGFVPGAPQSCLPNPTCDLQLRIVADGNTEAGDDNFIVTGSLLDDKTTTVYFTVKEPPLSSRLSCEAEGNSPYFVGQEVTWTATLNDPQEGEEVFYWQGSEGLDDVCTPDPEEKDGEIIEPCKSVKKSYLTFGRKTAQVALKEEGPYVDCPPITVIFRRIRFEGF